ncbi:hypothetical protein [uncultured Dokdonia sp.]|uniref:hypothetical protein n=1 Tax=uncultured Dokdonia sp. TaxID=575653 RepID=UPI00261E7D48|nr:hypothetical protein [uncultured Dokdonia sp.]
MSSKNKFGVTAAKKAEINALESRILTAQNTVGKSQAIVTSLTEKSARIEGELNTSDTNKTNALNTKRLLETVIGQVKEVYDNSKIVVSQTEDANSKTKSVAVDIKILIDKLIYTVDVVNKLSNLVIRKKAVNPLTSDELVHMLETATEEANNAVALTLVALNSVFVSQTSIIASSASTDLENVQVEKLYTFMTQEGEVSTKNIKQLVDQMYEDALTVYTSTLEASQDIAKQLSNATADFNRADANLSSLQAGLAAAQAAVLAS